MPDRENEKVIASFEGHVDGTRIPAEAEVDLFLLEVAESVEEIGMFTLSLNAGDPHSGGIKWVDTDLFREGNEVKIKVGFHAPLAELMVGEITSLEPDFPAAGPITLIVRGFDRLYRLGFGRKTRSFRNMKDSDIATQIAQDRGLTADAEQSTATHPYLLQNNQTDIEFLSERARQLRYEIKVEGKTLLFRKPRETQNKAVTLTYGAGLLSFAPRTSLAGQTSEVVVQAWDPKDKKAIQGRAADGDEASKMGGRVTGPALAGRVAGASPMVVVADPATTPEEAEEIAKGRFNAVAFSFVEADGSCMGEPLVRAGAVVEIAELGQRFSGLYYVTSCLHSVSGRSGYVTNFSARRSAT